MSPHPKHQRQPSAFPSDPLWFKDAVIYQVHVRTFADSNGDGIGDFPGLASKLDYLQELGVTAIWLLPFYPSPLRDEGYDIADYRDVNPIYGELDDFRRVLEEAHDRGLRVITELVINHTSDQHPWFQRARRAAPGSPERDYYVWSDTPNLYRDARIIFQDFESSNWSWDPLAGAYYWHRFYHHQPDLNFENPEVRREVKAALDFWLDMGVDGMRLDAIPYLYEEEGTNCENLPPTHAFLKELRAHVDARYEDKMLLAEANQWPEDAVEYFGDGDECQMSFHFPVMPRLFMAVRMEDRFPIIDILEQTPDIPESCQWAVFLRNHDELTLEMVTDEDRDYMYRVYAAEPRARINLGIRRRLAPLLGNDRRRIELMNALLMALPGTPILYYGDEIGMGDNFYLGDRNGVRTPMQWSPDRNAGFSQANPHKLYLPVIIDPEYHYEAINVETQQGNPHSLLRWIRRLIALRKKYKAFGRGTIEFLQPENHRVLAFLRRYEDEVLLMVANLSRFVQHVELDLSEFEGVEPVELFGRTRFPRIGELTYLLTLGPHGVYWFGLSEAADELVQRPEQGSEAWEPGRPALPAIPTLTAAGSWDTCLAGTGRRELARLLPPVFATRRWFGGKGRSVRSSEVRSVVRIDSPKGSDSPSVCLTLIELEYREEEPETYVLPLAFARAHSRGQSRGPSQSQASPGEESPAERLLRERPEAALARAELTEGKRRRAETTHGVLYDAVFDPELGRRLLEAIERQQSFPSGPDGEKGKVVARRTDAFAALRGDGDDTLPARLLSAEQSNTSVLFGDRLILKLFRKLEPGENPDLEIGRFLTEQTDFRNIPPVAGSLEYRPERSRDRSGEPATLAILQGYVDNEGDAWRFTLDFLSRYFERVLSRGELSPPPGPPVGTRPLLLHRPTPPQPQPETAHETEHRVLVSPTGSIGSAGASGTGAPGAAGGTTERELADLFGIYPSQATLLGQRTGELHLALASGIESKAFAPEPFSELYQRSLYQSMRSSTGKTFRVLKRRLDTLPDEAERDAARRLLDSKDALLSRFKPLLGRKIEALRIRCHGDYHLGQVLYTGKDFVIIDFEGEPARPLSERRIKRSPLRDVAGMLRSFDYAVHAALQEQIDRGVFGPEQAPILEQWGRLWSLEASAAFLGGYLEALAAAEREPALIPATEDEIRLLLDVFLLDKAIYELRYELDNRPGWARIPLHGILRLIGDGGADRGDPGKDDG